MKTRIWSPRGVACILLFAVVLILGFAYLTPGHRLRSALEKAGIPFVSRTAPTRKNLSPLRLIAHGAFHLEYYGKGSDFACTKNSTDLVNRRSA